MYVLLSPAKKLNEGPCVADLPQTELALADDLNALLKVTRPLKPDALKGLMGISDALADLNASRFAAMTWPMTSANARQAALLFAGDTYTGFDAPSLSAEDWAFARERVGILSGLYGLLRPSDLIQPYRLEMGTRLANPRGKNLYAFWGDRISTLIDERVAGQKDPVVINCASNEYFKAAATKSLKARVITPVFLEQKGDVAKTISFLAKKARGAMARYAVTQRVTDSEDLKGFDALGYEFDPERSEADRWVFVAQRAA